ncbi:MAG: ankyrin repeat domain-containing protein, partial [Alphaproteobacteria bacterium]
PSSAETAAYDGLHKAAHDGDIAALRHLIGQGDDVEARDVSGRTPLHVAAYASQDEAVSALAAAGADMNALEHQAYDIVTIAAVADDLGLLDLVLRLGAEAGNTTSPYDGTALIAAAHLGHHAIVGRLIKGGAPLDHINNIGWTALMEAVVLGDGGRDHVETARQLVEAGADITIADRRGVTPHEHARARGYSDMLVVLAGTR